MVGWRYVTRSYLDGGGVVKLEGLGLSVLQIDLQYVGQEEEGVSLEDSGKQEMLLSRCNINVVRKETRKRLYNAKGSPKQK